VSKFVAPIINLKKFMKKQSLFLPIVFLGSFSIAQVGVNTDQPKTTLDVSVKRNSTNQLEDLNQTYGIQAPRLSRAELTSLTSTYGTNQIGATIYITDVQGGNTNGQRVNVNSIGYYYFDGLVWIKINSSEPWQVKGTETPATENSQSIYQMGFIGIGTKDPIRGLHLVGTGDGGASDDLVIDSNNPNQSSSGQVSLRRAKGTSLSPAVVANGDKIGDFLFAPYANSEYRDRAGISGIVNGTVSGTTVPTDLILKAGSTEATERMRLKSDGNVGIGTIDPKQKLHVDGIIKSKGLTNGDVVISGDYGIYNTTNNWLRFATRGGDNGASGTSKIAFYTNATDANPTGSGTTPAVTIDNGRLGINTATPSNLLDVKSGTNGKSGVTLSDFKNINYLGTNASGEIIQADINTALNSLAVPRTAVYRLNGADPFAYLNGVSIGNKVNFPVTQLVNGIGSPLTFNSGTNTLTFQPGVYQITFTYESNGTTSSNCTLSSYFVDMPTGSGTSTARIHTTSAHNEGGTQNHGGNISFTAVITGQHSWKIEIGRGQSGNCNNVGTYFKNASSSVTVVKLQ
jgi:hypothetical protein